MTGTDPSLRTPPRRAPRWSRLCLKELREILRDRRTLITLVLMPLLVYPILSLVFHQSLLSVWGSSQRNEVLIGVTNPATAEFLQTNLVLGDQYLKRHEQPRKETDPKPPNPQQLDQLVRGEIDVQNVRFVQNDMLEQMVRSERLDIAIYGPSETSSRQYEIRYREGSALSLRALKFVEQRMAAVNEVVLRQRLRETGGSPMLVFRPQRRPLKTETGDSTLSTIVPMILILMTVTGAVYPAIDLTAGERERGTLEMLMASPVPRLRLLLAKYTAVVSVAFLTAIVNLTAMGITLWATGLSQILFGDGGISLTRVLQILALLILFAAFFSAVLLALTSFARSFKEAQAYLIPLMLLSLGPGIVSLLPGLPLTGVLCITPIANMVLLARDVCGGGADPLMATVVVVATSIYTFATVGVAAKIFGTDAVMSGSRVELRDAFFQNERRDVSSVSGALLCLAILFPCYFLVSNTLGQFKGLPIPVRLAVSALATSLLFGVLPWIATRLQGLRTGRALQFSWPSGRFWLVALVWGVSMWPIAHELVLWMEQLGVSTLGEPQIAQAKQLLVELRKLSPVWGVLAMAVAPAVCEEIFFRGYLFSALKQTTSRRMTISVTAVLFGLFHVVLAGGLSIERLLPSTFMGLVLGWLCYQSGSVLPGMLLHACHNGLLLLIGYYQEPLEAMGFGIEETVQLPRTWIAGALVALVSGLWVTAAKGPRVTVPTGRRSAESAAGSDPPEATSDEATESELPS